MLLIHCPHCGPRAESEFRYGGEAHVLRPTPAAAADEMQWAQFLFYRSNTRGIHAERWLHANGCGRWFNAIRDTVSDRFVADGTAPS